MSEIFCKRQAYDKLDVSDPEIRDNTLIMKNLADE